jgi:hypothetical protein
MNLEIVNRLDLSKKIDNNYNDIVSKICIWLNQFDIFKAQLSKLNVLYNIIPNVTNSGFTSNFTIPGEVNKRNTHDIFLGIINNKFSYFIKNLEFSFIDYYIMPKRKQILDKITDTEYVDLKLKLISFIDCKVKNALFGKRSVIENISYSYMDESNYLPESDPGNYYIHYEITKNNTLELTKIIQIYKDKTTKTFTKKSKKWEEKKIQSLYKSFVNHIIFYHTFIHVTNSNILNEFSKYKMNTHIIKLLNCFSEGNISNYTIGGYFFGKEVTDIIFNHKEDYLYHIKIKELGEINLWNEENSNLNTILKEKYFSYNILTKYKKVINTFVNSYIKQCDLTYKDTEIINTVCLYINSKFQLKQKIHTINDILSLYILNVILHSINHHQISFLQILLGRLSLVSKPNQQNLAEIASFSDTFGYNLDFWLDKKFEKTICDFQKNLKKVDSYTKSVNLNKIYGLDVISSAINS